MLCGGGPVRVSSLKIVLLFGCKEIKINSPDLFHAAIPSVEFAEEVAVNSISTLAPPD